MSQLTYGKTPPITPYWVKNADVKNKINCWLEDIIDSKLEPWIDRFFGEDHGTLQSDVLKVVSCVYHNNAAAAASSEWSRGPRSHFYEVLRKALKLLILEVAMGHQICIPDHAKVTIQSTFPGRYTFSPGPTSPRMVNRILKSTMALMMKYLTTGVLKGMEALWRSRGNDAWTESVCIMIALLTAGGGVQVSLADWAQVSRAHDDSSDISAMNPALENMEQEFCKHFILLFHARFKSANSRTRFNPFLSHPKIEELDSATRDMVKGVWSVFQRYRESSGPLIYISDATQTYFQRTPWI